MDCWIDTFNDLCNAFSTQIAVDLSSLCIQIKSSYGEIFFLFSQSRIKGVKKGINLVSS